MACIQHLQITQNYSLIWQQFIPRRRWRSQLEAISQKRHSRKFFKWRGCIQHVQITQNQSFISQQFIPRSSSVLPVNSPYLKNNAVENLLDVAVAFSTFKCPKISHSFDKSLSPGGGRRIIISSCFFPNLTLLTLFGKTYNSKWAFYCGKAIK